MHRGHGLIASLHLVEYRKRALSPPKRLAGHVAGLRFWRPLNIGGDFAWFREHPSRRSLYPRLKPDFHRWAFYAVWEEEAALEGFLTASEIGCGWSEAAAEACHFWLRPNRVRGPWAGMQVLRASETPGQAGRPVAYLARLDLSPRGTLAMWGSAAPGLLHHLPDSDELLLGLPLVDRPYTQPVSFSVWRTRQSAMRFAHRDEGHRDAVRRVQSSQRDVVDRFSSGRFEPYRCEGTWKARNVLSLASHAGETDSAQAVRVGAPARHRGGTGDSPLDTVRAHVGRER
jgi:hypothetical protein